MIGLAHFIEFKIFYSTTSFHFTWPPSFWATCASPLLYLSSVYIQCVCLLVPAQCACLPSLSTVIARCACSRMCLRLSVHCCCRLIQNNNSVYVWSFTMPIRCVCSMSLFSESVQNESIDCVRSLFISTISVCCACQLGPLILLAVFVYYVC